MTGRASEWIRRFAHLVPAGARVLDVACGKGRHARLFLERGHPVVVVDRDLSGVADLIGRSDVEAIEADLEAGAAPPFRSQRFGGVVVTNYLHRPLFPDLVAAVGSGGALLYETFGAGNEAFGRPRNLAFLLQPGELLRVVDGALQVVAYAHGTEVFAPLAGRPTRSAVRQRVAAVRQGAPVPLQASPPASGSETKA